MVCLLSKSPVLLEIPYVSILRLLKNGQRKSIKGYIGSQSGLKKNGESSNPPSKKLTFKEKEIPHGVCSPTRLPMGDSSDSYQWVALNLHNKLNYCNPPIFGVTITMPYKTSSLSPAGVGHQEIGGYQRGILQSHRRGSKLRSVKDLTILVRDSGLTCFIGWYDLMKPHGRPHTLMVSMGWVSTSSLGLAIHSLNSPSLIVSLLFLLIVSLIISIDNVISIRIII